MENIARRHWAALATKAAPTLAWVLLVNSGLGLAVWLTTAVIGKWHGLALADLPLVGLFGLLCAALCLKGQAAGWWGAIAFYAVQVPSYFSYTEGSFAVRAGLSLAGVFHLPGGVLVLNLAALLLLAASAAVLTARLRRPIPSAAP